MKIMILDGKERCGRDQSVRGLGYIQRNGINLLPTIVRLGELLSRTIYTYTLCVKFFHIQLFKNLKEVRM